MSDRLAQVLHCPMKSVACPMASCTVADSRAGYRQRFDDVEGMTRFQRCSKPYEEQDQCITILCSMLSPGRSRHGAKPTSRCRNILNRVEATRCDMRTRPNDY